MNPTSEIKSVDKKANESVENLDKWKNEQFNMAIVGDPSPLKALFINKLAGFDFSDSANQTQVLEIDASVNNAENNPFLNNYKIHANNGHFFLWDLKSKQDEKSIEEYMNEIEAGKYDTFILFRESDFTQIDFELAREIEKLNKNVYFVRFNDTNVSKNDTSEKKPGNFYDFTSTSDNSALCKLNLDILNNLKDEDKKRVYVFSMEPLSKEILEKKSSTLYERLHNVALKSTLLGRSITLPGLTIMADLCLLSAEIWFYREQLGLNKRSLQKIKNSAKDLYDKIGNLMEGSKYAAYLALTDIHSFSGVILKTLPLLANSNMIDIVVMAPILGLALRDAKSFATTKYALTSILDEFNKIACDIQTLKSSHENPPDYKSIEASVTQQSPGIEQLRAIQ
jgi:hypothetical protein